MEFNLFSVRAFYIACQSFAVNANQVLPNGGRGRIHVRGKVKIDKKKKREKSINFYWLSTNRRVNASDGGHKLVAYDVYSAANSGKFNFFFIRPNQSIG